MAAVKFQIDSREFDRTLRRYVEFSKRDFPTICNTKAFFIARRAVIETPKAQKSDINRLISRTGAVILGKIINKRRGEKGLRGLTGEAMRQAQLVVIAARKRSVAFLKSGWLPAIRILEPLSEKRGAPRRPGRDVVEYGKKKGSATPARPGFKIYSQIVNAADAKHDKKGALLTYGLPALQKAFNFETLSMKEYIERKMRGSAKSAGIRTN